MLLLDSPFSPMCVNLAIIITLHWIFFNNKGILHNSGSTSNLHTAQKTPCACIIDPQAVILQDRQDRQGVKSGKVCDDGYVYAKQGKSALVFWAFEYTNGWRSAKVLWLHSGFKYFIFRVVNYKDCFPVRDRQILYFSRMIRMHFTSHRFTVRAA